MSGILETFEKQPGEVRYFDISFVDWLAKVGDTGASVTGAISNAPDSSLVLSATLLNAGVVRIVVSGGTSGKKYTVSVRVTTAFPQVKEADVYVKVKEIK